MDRKIYGWMDRLIDWRKRDREWGRGPGGGANERQVWLYTLRTIPCLFQNLCWQILNIIDIVIGYKNVRDKNMVERESAKDIYGYQGGLQPKPTRKGKKEGKGEKKDDLLEDDVIDLHFIH